MGIGGLLRRNPRPLLVILLIEVIVYFSFFPEKCPLLLTVIFGVEQNDNDIPAPSRIDTGCEMTTTSKTAPSSSSTAGTLDSLTRLWSACWEGILYLVLLN